MSPFLAKISNIISSWTWSPKKKSYFVFFLLKQINFEITWNMIISIGCWSGSFFSQFSLYLHIDLKLVQMSYRKNCTTKIWILSREFQNYIAQKKTIFSIYKWNLQLGQIHSNYGAKWFLFYRYFCSQCVHAVTNDVFDKHQQLISWA